MNETLYTQALNKVTMSQECEEKIIEAAFNPDTSSKTIKKAKRIRFIPVLTAAAVILTCGTWAAAENGGFDWLHSILSFDSNEEVSDYTKNLIGEMRDFSFESTNENVSFTPVGMIADEQNLYCVVKPEGINPVQIEFINLISDSIDYNAALSYCSGPLRDDTSQNLIVTFSLSEQQFTEGSKIDIYLSDSDLYLQKNLDDDNVQKFLNDVQTGHNISLSECNLKDKFNLFKVSFTLDFGEFNTLDVDYSNYSGEVKYKMSRLIITPLSTTIYSNGYSIYNNELQIIMSDGNIVSCTPHSGGSNDNNTDVEPNNYAQWCFSEPINPDNISKVYLRDSLIYEKE